MTADTINVENALVFLQSVQSVPAEVKARLAAAVERIAEDAEIVVEPESPVGG